MQLAYLLEDKNHDKKAGISRSRLSVGGCPEKLCGAGASPAEPRKLRASSRPQRQIAHLRQNARHLHSIQLRNEGQYLCDKLILHQLADFFLAIAFAA